MKRILCAVLLAICALLFGAAAETVEPEVALEGFDVPAYFDPGNINTPEGTIRSSLPFSVIRMRVYNERLMRDDASYDVDLGADKAVTEYDAYKQLQKLRLYNLKGGERTLIVEIEGEFGAKRVLEKPFYVRGWCPEPASIIRQCAVTTSTGAEAPGVISGSFFNGWANKTGTDYLQVTLPSGVPAGGLSLMWEEPPRYYRVECDDAAGERIATIESENPGQFYNTFDELPPETACLRVYTNSKVQLCVLRVYEQGKIPSVVQRWQILPEDVDLMYIGAHKNDETVFFSGSIPLTIAEGRTAAVVLMTEYDTRSGDEEFFEALWALGVRYHPIMLRKWDGKQKMEVMEQTWGGYDNCCGELVALMRRYRPEVVLTHDIDGENGHIQHILTARLVIDAVDRSGDGSWYPESASAYGAWDVPKLYLHLYDENRRLNLPFYKPQEYYQGRSAMDMAYSSFDKYQSQINASNHYSLDVLGRWHDKTFFGLYRTTVGEDEAMNSFFEHIDP